MKQTNPSNTIIFIFLFVLISLFCFSQEKAEPAMLNQNMEEQINRLMAEGKVPGMSLVIIDGDKQFIKNYGYADAEKKRAVTANTLFELGSCSKAFTALAFLKLAEDNKIDLDQCVSSYLPWFYATYEDHVVKITLRQLLNHTSGIPWQTISSIPQSNANDALEQTVKRVVGVKLDEVPGKQYEYATINYDILALVIEKVSHASFEDYVTNNVLKTLQLLHSSVGIPIDKDAVSKGFRISFFKAREYDAPVFKGNNAAGYVISNASDIAKWMKFQMGLTPSELSPLATQSHLRDETVPPHGFSSYAMGWEISISGNGEISHSGLNPNFSSYLVFRPKKKLGVAILANSNSGLTPFIGDKIMKLLAGDEIKNDFRPDTGNDQFFSIISIILCCFLLVAISYLCIIIMEMIRGIRKYESFSSKKVAGLAWSLLFIAPILYGIYLLPKAIAGFTWEAVAVWTPASFISMISLIIASIGCSYLIYTITMFFPGNKKFVKQVPQLIMVSIISGISNMIVILLITSSLKETIELKYLGFYYLITLMIYIAGRKYVESNLINYTRELIYNIRMKLVEKIFSTSYQKFEKIDRGRVYSTLNDDVSMVGNSTNMVVGFVTSFITVTGAFLYLATIAFWATLLTLTLVIVISFIYFNVSKSTQVYFEDARDTQNVFMRLLNGLIDGFKEISLQKDKKLEYKNDIDKTTSEYKEKTTIANIKFINAFLVGESLLIVLLGIVAFSIPKVFPGIELYTIMSFIVVLLYLNGPLGIIFGSIPTILQLKIAWNRIQDFISEIPANLDLTEEVNILNKELVNSIKAENVSFTYDDDDGGKENFSVGPINLEVERGQILFIIGGNGSGKTTLAKLITGLYEPSKGKMFINNEVVGTSQVGEYFSTVFSPCHLFEKMYNVDMTLKSEKVKKYLNVLGLTDKVEIRDNTFSTINLSGGQRKRLALLQCYLEDSPIYLFDEWAADQDPEYRRFFYKELLPEMRMKNKIVIAITHDDHYFDVADKIIKMDMGKVEYVTKDFKVDEVLAN
jgi:putative ATP-binding cassette transporter